MTNFKIAFLFPGQGSQYVGMGKDFFDRYDFAKDIFKDAADILGFDIASLCFNGPEEELTRTYNTQPALLINSIIAAKVLKEHGITPYITAGHSLGEYSALVSTSVLTLKDAVKIVRKRGEYMQDAVPEGAGGMAAIIGLSRGEIETLCKECSEAGIVSPANFNSPIQTVIAGEKRAVTLAVARASEMGAKKSVMLQVSAPFHCSMMKKAEERLSVDLDNIVFSNPAVPVVKNVDAREVKSGENAKEALKKQVSSPVLWEDSMSYMLSRGDIDCFIEVGPGKVLGGLMKRIDKSAKVFNVEDMDSLGKTLDGIKELKS